MPIALLSRRTVTPLPRTCFPNAKNPRLMKETGVLVALVESELSGRLVLDDLGDRTHGALLDAVATSDASFLVHGVGNAIDDLEHFLGARVNADAAADALVSFNYGMRHGKLLRSRVIILVYEAGAFRPPLLHCARYHERAKAQVEIENFSGGG